MSTAIHHCLPTSVPYICRMFLLKDIPAWQAQERARSWFQRKVREQAGDFVSLDLRYTVAHALADYRVDYQRRSGKATDRLDASTGAWIEPELGMVPLDKLTKRRIVGWHQKIVVGQSVAEIQVPRFEQQIDRVGADRADRVAVALPRQ
jgi:hypothetical protein